MIICGECGETYRRHQQYNKYKKYYIWACKKHENKGVEYCRAKPIREGSVEEAFIRALNGLVENREHILEKLQTAVVANVSDSCAEQFAELEKEIQTAQETLLILLKNKREGEITESKYAYESKRIMFQVDQLNLKKEETLSEQGKMQLAEYRADAVAKLLNDGTILNKFDKTIFKSSVRRIVVVKEKEIEIEFECGIKVRETVE